MRGTSGFRLGLLVLTAGLVALALWTAALTNAEEPDAEAIDAFVSDKMALARLPGLGLAVAREDRIVHLRGYGVSDPSGREVTPQAPFVVGSILADEMAHVTAIAPGVTGLVTGGAPLTFGTDSHVYYPFVTGILVGMALQTVMLLGAGRALRSRRRRERGSWRALWKWGLLLTLAALPAPAYVFLMPQQFGGTIALAWLLQPDLVLLMMLSAALGVAAALTLVGHVVLASRSDRRLRSAVAG